MHRGGRRSIAVITMAMALRQASCFVAPLRAAARRTAGGGVNAVSSRIVRCSMSASAAAATPRVTLPIIDAEATERRAERLWEMADAQMPRSLEGGLSEVNIQDGEDTIQESQEVLSFSEIEEEESDFVEQQGEVSALRRYQYDDLVEDEGVDDDKEYYI